MTVVRVRPKAVELEAMQVVVGLTTKRAILEFCPEARVGAPEGPGDDEGLDSSDLRYVAIETADGNLTDMHDTDWILKGCTGRYFVRSEEEYAEDYEEVPSKPDGSP